MCIQKSMANLFSLICLFMLIATHSKVLGQGEETIPSGSIILDMGVPNQSVDKGLKPYGLVYQLLNQHNVPIKWAINQTKGKNGVDFVHNGYSFKGGPFIIYKQYLTPAVMSTINSWSTVEKRTTVSEFSTYIAKTLTFSPRWVLDNKSGSIAVKFLQAAGIPEAAFGGTSKSGWKDPQSLNCCDDLFVMPHADPKWSSHNKLFTWNDAISNGGCMGGIWLGCHSGSALEGMFNPSSPSQQTNFLANKSGLPGSLFKGTWAQNALILWDNHEDGTPPNTYDHHSEPVMQFLGSLDGAASSSGSEQIYVPYSPGWRTTTKVGVYDPNHPDRISSNPIHRAGVLVFGRAFGNNNRGLVCMQGGHDISGNGTDNVAAMRAFFNFSYDALADKTIVPTLTNVPLTMSSGSSNTFSVTLPQGINFSGKTIQWTSSCGGTFSPSASASTVTWTAPNITSPTNCVITCKITETACGRKSFASQAIYLQNCSLTFTNNISNLCPGSTNTGAILFVPTGALGPYNYSWARSSGGTGTGTGTTISGLSPATYTVTVTGTGGCTGTFNAVVGTNPNITITPVTTVPKCVGSNTGTITLTTTGGTPGYTYNWGSGVTTKNRTNLAAGSYTVTVTDTKSCTASSTITIAAPLAITSTNTKTNVLCNGGKTGTINLTISGGLSPYKYLWNNGATTQNRTGLAAGTFTVTVTDANNCTFVPTAISISQPSDALSITNTTTNPSCGSNNGAITTSVLGGTPPYTYDWGGGITTQNRTGLASGTYKVIVTDNNLCTSVKSITLSPASRIVVNSNVVVNPSCPPGSNAPLGTNGSISLTVTGGTAPYTYQWSTSNGSGLVPTNMNQTGLSAGTYTVTVTGSAPVCTSTLQVVLTNTNNSPQQPNVIQKN
jgi:hypothetical protein